MSQESRRKWKRKLCLEKSNCLPHMNLYQNVTLRKANSKPETSPNPLGKLTSLQLKTIDGTQTYRKDISPESDTASSEPSTPNPGNRPIPNSLSDEAEEYGSSFNNTIHSLPNFSFDYNALELQQGNQKLKTELETAHTEIEHLNSEITKLNNEVKQCRKTIELYKKIDTEKLITPQTRTKKKKNRRNSSSIRISPTKPMSTTNENTLQPQEYNTSSQSDSAETNRQYTDNINPPCNTALNSEATSYSEKLKNRNNTLAPPITLKTPGSKHRIAITSSNNKNKMLEIAERELDTKFQLCHYLYPYCGIKELFAGISERVKDYTAGDYCVIMIGEEDFHTANDYQFLVKLIRETLLKLTHTNFIICLPTFKQGAAFKAMFNFRAELFNNLLWLDVGAHKYATILDSNLHLPYEQVMYDYRYGFLKDNGMTIVIRNLNKIINDHIRSTTHTTEAINPPTYVNEKRAERKHRQENFLFRH